MLALVRPASAADTPLRDPRIPDGEIAAYSQVENEREMYFTETFSIDKDGEKTIYYVLYESESETIRVKIEKDSMLPYYVRSSTAGENMDTESLTELTLNRDLDFSDIMVLSFSDLKYILRGFPFDDETDSLDIAFLSSADDNEEESSFDFSVRVNYEGTELITVGERDIDCYKLELKASASGILKIFNSFIGKTFFWYSVAPPHYLVAYRGNSGFPGSPKTYIEINNYSGWN